MVLVVLIGDCDCHRSTVRIQEHIQIVACDGSAVGSFVGPTGPPLIFFVPAVAISAWQGGGGPGLLATARGSALAYNYFPPIGSLAISNPGDITRMMAFVFEGILTSVLMERLRRARRQVEKNRREADGLREASPAPRIGFGRSSIILMH